MKNTTNICEIINNEIKNKTLDLSIDYVEILFDKSLSEEILTEIPLVKSILSFYNIKNSFTNKLNTKKIIHFFQTLNSSKINDEDYNEFLYKYNSDKEYQDKVIETIVFLNERFLQIEKSKILANLIAAHIKKELSWEELSNILPILDTIHPITFSALKDLYESNWTINVTPSQEYQNYFLPNEALLVACGILNRQGTRVKVEKLGQQLYEFGIKPSQINF